MDYSDDRLSAIPDFASVAIFVQTVLSTLQGQYYNYLVSSDELGMRLLALSLPNISGSVTHDSTVCIGNPPLSTDRGTVSLALLDT